MKYEFRTIGLLYRNSLTRLAYTSAAVRLGARVIAVELEEDNALEALEELDICCDAIVVEDLNTVPLFARNKPILVASLVDSTDIPKAVEGLLYISR